jgi:beta-glucosidase
MPGTRKFRSQYQMGLSVQARKITVKAIKDRARKVLELVQKASKGCPEVRSP